MNDLQGWPIHWLCQRTGYVVKLQPYRRPNILYVSLSFYMWSVDHFLVRINQLIKNTDVYYASFNTQWGSEKTASDQSFGPLLYLNFQLY